MNELDRLVSVDKKGDKEYKKLFKQMWERYNPKGKQEIPVNTSVSSSRDDVTTGKEQTSLSFLGLISHLHNDVLWPLRACWQGGGGPQVGEVTRLDGVARLSV